MIEHAVSRGESVLSQERSLLEEDWRKAIEAFQSDPSRENRQSVRTLATAIDKHNVRAERAGRFGIRVEVPEAAMRKPDRKALEEARHMATHFPDGTERSPQDAALRLRLLEAESDC